MKDKYNIMEKIIEKAEEIIYFVLSALVILFVVYETFDLILLFLKEVSETSIWENKSIALTGVPIFFNIIIALEILETFKSHNADIIRKVKIIILVALTAISRKIIVMDIKHSEYHLLIGISVLFCVLCLGYFLVNYKSKKND